MYSLLEHFKETENLLHEKKKYRRYNKYLKDTSSIPDFHCPEAGSILHDRDVDFIKWYFDNKSLSKNFLTKSDDSVKKIYKDFCKENNLNVNWKLVKEILKDVYGVIGSQKKKYERPRPKEHLSPEDEKYKDIIDVSSYSFPSGHTTIAYFLSNMLSHFFPSHENDLKNLSALIGQSRIENCVHYPSDVLHGQLLGEMLFNLLLKNKDFHNDFSHMTIKKKDKKNLQKLFYDKSLDNSDFFYDISNFLILSGCDIPENECFKACKEYAKGYPIDKCTKNKEFKKFINAIVLCNKIDGAKNIFDYTLINRAYIGKNPVLRSYKKNDSGYECSDPNKIVSHMKHLEEINNPFSKNILFSLIQPFENNNDQINFICLLHESKYNLKKCLYFLENIFKSNKEKIKSKYVNIDNIFK